MEYILIKDTELSAFDFLNIINSNKLCRITENT